LRAVALFPQQQFVIDDLRLMTAGKFMPCGNSNHKSSNRKS
jgi:hypothetical protein